MDKTDDEFLEVYKYLKRKKRDISLFSVYKGIPVTSVSPIVYAGQNTIIVNLSEYQAVCLSKFKTIFLKSDVFPRVVQADLVEMDLNSMCAALSNFRYVQSGVGERKILRVEPDGRIGGILQANSVQVYVNGLLADISRQGLALVVRETDIPGIFSQRGTEVTAFFSLPGVKIPKSTHQGATLPRYQSSVRPDVFSRFSQLEKSLFGENDQSYTYPHYDYPKGRNYTAPEFGLMGRIVNSRTEYIQGRYRVGVLLSSADASNALITKFVSKRQAEIIREIRSIFEQMKKDSRYRISGGN